MDEHISKTGYSSPINFWICGLQLRRDSLGGLGKDLEVSQNRILGLFVRQELLQSLAGVFLHTLD